MERPWILQGDSTTVPASDRIVRLSPDPPVWFLGQFVRFILRPNNKFLQDLDRMPNGGYAAIHVRRTDKIKENPYIDTQEYLDVVQEYFDIQDAKNLVRNQSKKTLFVASDEPDVIEEIQTLAPHLRVLSNATFAMTAEYHDNRYEDDSIAALISDVHMLARSDVLACTMSSNICRLAYELRMATRPMVADSTEVQTLDHQWAFLHPNYNSVKYYLAANDRNTLSNPSDLDLKKCCCR